MSECWIKPFDMPDEERVFTKGIFELINVAGMTLGRATYEPSWVWSKHVGPEIGKSSCDVAHVGIVLSGQVAVKMDDGREFTLNPGEVFKIDPGHDSWVVGNVPYVSLHLMGAEEYAK